MFLIIHTTPNFRNFILIKAVPRLQKAVGPH